MQFDLMEKGVVIPVLVSSSFHVEKLMLFD